MQPWRLLAARDARDEKFCMARFVFGRLRVTYPAGMIPGSRLLDASPHKVNWQQTIQICKDYEFLILFTSTVGLESDIKLIRKIKEANPSMKIAFVGPHGHIKPDETLMASEDIDFVTRGEFDHSVVEYAHGKPLDEILGVSYRKDGKIVHNAERPQLHTEELDALPYATDIYKRDLEIERYNVPFLLHPYVSFYTTRGCPALCTFCMWPQTISGHAWRTRSTENVAREVKQALGYFPQMKEIFFDDDTFNIRKDRVLDLSAKFKPLKFQWSSTARVHSDYETVKAMADGGARLFIVGFESGEPQILKTINFAKELDCETIQVSLAHAMPGTELHDTMAQQGFLKVEALADSGGHQLPHIEYPHLSKAEMMAGVNRFYDEYYFRPKVVWRIVKEALWDSNERKRLYYEAKEFLKLRAERLKWARKGGEDYNKPIISVPGTSSASGND